MRYWREGLISDFESGLMENDHWNLARLMSKVAAPEFAPVYQRFFDERETFSEFARVAYSELLNSVTKTRDASLVPSIIDLTRREENHRRRCAVPEKVLQGHQDPG